MYIYTKDKQFCIETLLIFLWFVLILFGDIYFWSLFAGYTNYVLKKNTEKDIKQEKFVVS